MKKRTFTYQDVGKRVKVIANNAGHNKKLGSVFTIREVHSDVIYVIENGSGFYHSDLEILSVTKEDISEEIRAVENNLDDLKAKLKFMEDTNTDILDENEYRVYSTIQTLKSNLSDLDKSKAIAKLFK